MNGAVIIMFDAVMVGMLSVASTRAKSAMSNSICRLPNDEGYKLIAGLSRAAMCGPQFAT